MDISDIVKEARVIARRRLNGHLLLVALQCLNDNDVVAAAEKRLNNDPFGETEALRVLVMLCIEPQASKSNDKLE
ncbi:hypothetical protein [Caldivirga maquilingensis]|uniref:Uncharacterized protein n=1 Tax=Caldivirga maquilingensis (strain ATCC 700844 / DSM 13496 / JCM 10307 / IC-167) TaxID=397948 RepID=A8MD77_CALMQ|nr:hypothetical protein [Caldivirga maquilingensis]ABW01733.1 hypothetical protein Cmaq_0899 [Caldivirga maquilingensis IC-167]